MRHHVIENAGRLTRVVHRHNVRMRETRYCFNLLEKALGPERCRDVRVENLYGNAAIVPGIASAIDRGHSAAAYFILYGIAVTECPLKGVCCHVEW